jgi:predicted  nucleic acid-binding Zn-ribbon protein
MGNKMEITEQLNLLVRHQEIVLRLKKIDKWKSGKPTREGDLSKKVEEKAASVEETREKMKNLVSERKRLEGDLELHEGKVGKYQDQIRQVKTNEEYQALLKQLETTKMENSKLEDRILEIYDECDRMEEEIRSKEKEVSEEEQKFKMEMETILREEKEFEEEELGIKNEMEMIEKTLPAETLRLYRKVAGVRNSVAMAKAQDYICQECYVRVRPQPFVELQRGEKIIVCEGCRRLLYCAKGEGEL